MKASRFVLWLLLVASGASAQTLDCPGSASPARPCEAFHYHLMLYRPDPKGFVEVWGANQFATQSACERSREEFVRRNLAVVDYWRRVRNEQQYEPDRAGSCHCDMTLDKANPRHLTDAQRLAQVRAMEEVRQRVRERLLDSGLTSENEIVRGVLIPYSAPSPILAGAKLVAPPRTGAVAQVTNAGSDLRGTRASDGTRPVAPSLDLPLVDIPVSPAIAQSAAAASGTSMTITEPLQPAPAVPSGQNAVAAAGDAASAAPAETPAATPNAAPASRTALPAASAATKEETETAQEAVESFISYESERIQNVLKASEAVADEAVKSKIFEAVQQRIQLLGNLRDLFAAAGMKSRLAAGARAARSEEERLAFVARLFGSAMTKHWAPKDASDVILEADPAVESSPEGVLRDSSGRFTEQQKKRALYLLLARSQPTEEQQLWLTTVVDAFLR